MIVAALAAAALAQAELPRPALEQPPAIPIVNLAEPPRPPPPPRVSCPEPTASRIIPLCVEEPTPVKGIGGVQVARGDAPYIVEIYSTCPGLAQEAQDKKISVGEYVHRCGATLIARDWAVTTAHCIDRDIIAKGLRRVRVGAARLDNGEGQTLAIDRMVRHADFVDCARGGPDTAACTHANDIALVHLTGLTMLPYRPGADGRFPAIPARATAAARSSPISASARWSASSAGATAAPTRCGRGSTPASPLTPTGSPGR